MGKLGGYGHDTKHDFNGIKVTRLARCTPKYIQIYAKRRQPGSNFK